MTALLLAGFDPADQMALLSALGGPADLQGVLQSHLLQTSLRRNLEGVLQSHLLQTSLG